MNILWQLNFALWWVVAIRGRRRTMLFLNSSCMCIGPGGGRVGPCLDRPVGM